MPDIHKDVAYSLVATAPSPATSGTTLVVTAGEGARFPTGSFDVLVCPASTQPVWGAGLATGGNFEMCRATIATDTLTLTRAQYGTTARTVVVGDQVFVPVNSRTLTDVEGQTDWYGDGSDGAFTADGTTAMPGASRVGTVYTLTRNVYFTALTVNSGVTIFLNSWLLNVNGTLTNTGALSANGGIPGPGAGGQSGLNQGADGSGTGNIGGSGGATSNYLGYGRSGGLANGSAGTNSTNSFGGAAGGGGSASGGGSAGGAGGTATIPPVGLDDTRTVQNAVVGRQNGAATLLSGGGGGGGAANDTVNQGGGGGGGGGILILNGRIVVNNGTIQARGAKGANAVAGNSGGGGGGGGGVLFINTTAYSGTGSYDANGGALGTKQGTGVDGVAGSAGTVRLNIWR